MAPPDRRIELRREAQVAAATVPAAHLDDDGAAADAAESIVRGQKDPRDGLAEGGHPEQELRADLDRQQDRGLRPGKRRDEMIASLSKS